MGVLVVCVCACVFGCVCVFICVCVCVLVCVLVSMLACVSVWCVIFVGLNRLAIRHRPILTCVNDQHWWILGRIPSRRKFYFRGHDIRICTLLKLLNVGAQYFCLREQYNKSIFISSQDVAQGEEVQEV